MQSEIRVVRTHSVDKITTDGKVRFQRLFGERERETRTIGGRVPGIKVITIPWPRQTIRFT